MVDADKREQPSRAGARGRASKRGERQHERAEKALEAERDFFAAVLESADAFILVLDSAGRILHVNRAVKTGDEL